MCLEFSYKRLLSTKTDGFEDAQGVRQLYDLRWLEAVSYAI